MSEPTARFKAAAEGWKGVNSGRAALPLTRFAGAAGCGKLNVNPKLWQMSRRLIQLDLPPLIP